MANTRRRCTSCRDYFPRDQITRHGVCGDECLKALVQRSREKNRRRKPVTQERSDDASSDIRRRVRLRDNDRCRWCSSRAGLQVHHIKYRSEGGTNSMLNLITLCLECHARVHSDKRVYQPVLLGLIWLHYTEGRVVSVPQFMRWYPSVEADQLGEAKYRLQPRPIPLLESADPD